MRNNAYKTPKKKEKVYYYDAILVVIFFLLTGIEMNLAFTHFYTNYILYSLLASVILSLVTLYIIAKLRITKNISVVPWLTIPFIYIIINIFLIPSFLHYHYCDKKYQCFNAQLERKYIFHKRNQISPIGIQFDINYTNDLPKELMFFRHISDIDPFDYEQLPNKGKKIHICGEVSKIGFSLDYVKAMR